MHNDKNLLLRVTCFFWVIIRICGYKTWVTAGRLYPVIPPFAFLDAVPPVVHSVLYFLSVGGLLLLLVFPYSRRLVISTLLVILGCCLLDVLRWQPWEYQFIFFLAIVAINPANDKAVYSALVFVLASVYVYSGLHKLNGGFLYMVWESLMLHRFLGISRAGMIRYHLHYLGLLIPVIEAAAGLGLLLCKNKLLPVMALVSMHVFILVMLVCTGISYVSIVPQWNTAMILFLLIHYRKKEIEFSFPLLYRGNNRAVLLLWGVLPALSFIGCWDNFLSSSLYSGDMLYADICIGNTAAVAPLQPYFSGEGQHHICTGDTRISLYRWAQKETGVLPYPEPWYYKKLKAKFDKIYPGAQADCIMYAYPFKEREVVRRE